MADPFLLYLMQKNDGIRLYHYIMDHQNRVGKLLRELPLKFV